MGNSEWCVLRMGAASTLPLFDSLSAAGFDVWTPIEINTRRLFRDRVRKEARCVMMPTYIFARASQLPALLNIAMLPAREHRDFSIMRQANRFPLIADEDLAPLRTEERRVKPRAAAPQFAIGQEVRMEEGGFAGMTGIVQGTEGKFVLVAFKNSTLPPIRIANWWLLPDDEKCAMGRAA